MRNILQRITDFVQGLVKNFIHMKEKFIS